jgi:hypothetical protein
VSLEGTSNCVLRPQVRGVEEQIKQLGPENSSKVLYIIHAVPVRRCILQYWFVGI